MLIRLVLLAAMLFTFQESLCQVNNRYAIIPYPAQLEARNGEFIINPTTTIRVLSAEVVPIVELFTDQIKRSIGLTIPVHAQSNVALHGNLIQFQSVRDTLLGDEGYRLDVSTNRILVEASTNKGFFYAIQTLYQLMPPTVFGGHNATSATPTTSQLLLPILTVPNCHIQDRPRYVYRGMHLDVSRHFFSVSFIKKHLDLMALHKFNTFHWHLTDDQGWRIEIKKYPKLTQIGSKRSETIIGHYDDYDPQIFDGIPYNGFYTQDDIQEVVRYAAARFIDVVPEIEMPGHAMAALAAYPELACTPNSVQGGTFKVATKWGVFGDVFCPTEKTFSFLEDVLTEVMALFPSKYIHIGGDECPKTTWRKNPFCQQLIKRQRLKNAHELQRYFIKRIDKFVTSKGRRIIGWDEILQGSSPALRLSDGATVMSWRGIKGGIQAARQGHDVIMTPDVFCYFDHYQGNPAYEPTGFGGSVTLAKVYSFNPTPAELSPADATHILGAQSNLWTEYIPTPHQAEYMIWPRAAAMAEVLWTPQAHRDYTHFIGRLVTHFERLRALDVNFSRTLYDALPSATPTADGKLAVTLATDNQLTGSLAPEIRYTLDGSIPSWQSPLYEKPIVLTHSGSIRTATFQHGKLLGQLANIHQEYLISKATGKPYTLLNAPTNSRPDHNYSLTDGTPGSTGGYVLSGIVSFTNDLNVVINLGELQKIDRVRIGFLKYTARNVCLPTQVTISVSEDGKNFQSVLTTKTNAAERGRRSIVRLHFDFSPTEARYVRIIAQKALRVPAGLRNPGKEAKLAVDEIEVR